MLDSQATLCLAVDGHVSWSVHVSKSLVLVISAQIAIRIPVVERMDAND